MEASLKFKHKYITLALTSKQKPGRWFHLSLWNSTLKLLVWHMNISLIFYITWVKMWGSYLFLTIWITFWHPCSSWLLALFTLLFTLTFDVSSDFITHIGITYIRYKGPRTHYSQHRTGVNPVLILVYISF